MHFLDELFSQGFHVKVINRSRNLEIAPSNSLTPAMIEKLKAEKQSLIREYRKRKRNGGVGTELKRLIPKIFKSKGCNCDEYAEWLDVRGLDWCVNHRDGIVATLAAKARQIRPTKAWGWVSKKGASWFVDTAIRRVSKRANV